MTISTYAELQSAVRNWLHRSSTASLADARVQEFIALGEACIRRDLRVREMEASADLSLTADTATVALPDGFFGLRRLYLDGSPKRQIEYVTPEHIDDIWASSQTGPPKVVTIEGDNFRFAPTPDTAYAGKALLWKLVALSDSNTTEALLTSAPDLYLYAALAESAPYSGNDERLPMWESKYADTVRGVFRRNQRDRYSYGLRARTDTGTP